MHIILVHLEDFIRCALHLLKQRQNFLEVKMATDIHRQGLLFNFMQGRQVTGEKRFQCGSFFCLAGDRDVVQLDLERFLKDHFILPDLFCPLPLVPQKGRKNTAVHAFQGFLHILTGDDTAIVLAQDHIDGLT